MLYKFALIFVVSCVNYVNYLQPESLWKWARVLIITILLDFGLDMCEEPLENVNLFLIHFPTCSN